MSQPSNRPKLNKINKINKVKLYNAYIFQQKQILTLKSEHTSLTSEYEQLKLENKKLKRFTFRQKRTIETLKQLDLVNKLSTKLGSVQYKKICKTDDISRFKQMFETRIINETDYYISMLTDTDTQFIYEIIQDTPLFTQSSIGKILGWMENQTPYFN